MDSRKKKIEELLKNFGSLKRHMAFCSVGSGKTARVTPSQWGVLMMIEHRGESTVKEVAKALGITSSATTQLVDGLVASGYVVRKTHAEDRREVSLTLSNKTKTQVNKMKKEAMQKFLKFFEVLSDKEFNQYILLNEKIVERFSKNKKNDC